MAKKKREKEDERGSGNLVELAALGEENEKLARKLGYRERCSVNNICRGLETERRNLKLELGAAGVLVFITLVSTIAALAAGSERRARLLEVGGFFLLWGLLALFLAHRSRHRSAGLETLRQAVADKVGKG